MALPYSSSLRPLPCSSHSLPLKAFSSSSSLRPSFSTLRSIHGPYLMTLSSSSSLPRPLLSSSRSHSLKAFSTSCFKDSNLPIDDPIAMTHPIHSVNMDVITKLTHFNYTIWSRQISSFLEGQDLHRFIDPTASPPSPTIEINGELQTNPAYTAWIRQDKLLLVALIGSTSTYLHHLVASATTSLEAWNILASKCGCFKKEKDRELDLTKSWEELVGTSGFYAAWKIKCYYPSLKVSMLPSKGLITLEDSRGGVKVYVDRDDIVVKIITFSKQLDL